MSKPQKPNKYRKPVKHKTLFLVPGDDQHKLILEMLRDWQMQDLMAAYVSLPDEGKAELAKVANGMVS